MNKCYRVIWEIDLHAASPCAAGEKALEIHRDPESIATVFSVRKFPQAAQMESAYVRVFANDEVIDLSKARRRKT